MEVKERSQLVQMDPVVPVAQRSQSLAAQALYVFTGGMRMGYAILEPENLGSSLESETQRQAGCICLSL